MSDALKAGAAAIGLGSKHTDATSSTTDSSAPSSADNSTTATANPTTSSEGSADTTQAARRNEADTSTSSTSSTKPTGTDSNTNTSNDTNKKSEEDYHNSLHLHPGDSAEQEHGKDPSSHIHYEQGSTKAPEFLADIGKKSGGASAVEQQETGDTTGTTTS